MKRSLARFELDCDGAEQLFLLVGEDGANRVHVARETCYGEVGPEVTARHVLDAAVLARRVVESDPAREVRERSGASPVGIVLMPGDHAAVTRGLAEELVVPE